jgi:ABC-type transport system involved in multi-copper enzyme maturation permease subunit
MSVVPLRMNPVLRREMVERMRGGRTFVVLTLYLALLSSVVFFAYQVGRENDDPTQAALLGRGIFEWLVFFMLLLVLFIAPGTAASAIAGERERQTLVPLQVTLLSPQRILLGKIYAAVAFLLLLIVATMPLLSVSYLIGGVTMGEVLGGVGAVLFVGLAVGCLSAAISTFTRRVQGATVFSYGMVLLLLLGTIAAYGAANMIDESRGTDAGNAPSWLMLANPVAMISGVIGDGLEDGAMQSPFDPIEQWIIEGESDTRWEFMEDDMGGRVAIDQNGNIIDGGADFDESPEMPGWFLRNSLIALTAVAAAAVALGAFRLRTPAQSER